jgi:hypothetical protein
LNCNMEMVFYAKKVTKQQKNYAFRLSFVTFFVLLQPK